MSRHYDDASGRGSRSADPSIDAWFRELRGDPAGRGSNGPPARSASATRSRQHHHHVDRHFEDDWFRAEQARRSNGGNAPADSWSVDTRSWAPSWDNATTGYVARQAPRPNPNTLSGERQLTTGEQRALGRRPSEPPPRVDARPSEPLPRVDARPPEPRNAEVRDLREAREAREARDARDARDPRDRRDSRPRREPPEPRELRDSRDVSQPPEAKPVPSRSELRGYDTGDYSSYYESSTGSFRALPSAAAPPTPPAPVVPSPAGPSAAVPPAARTNPTPLAPSPAPPAQTSLPARPAARPAPAAPTPAAPAPVVPPAQRSVPSHAAPGHAAAVGQTAAVGHTAASHASRGHAGPSHAAPSQAAPSYPDGGHATISSGDYGMATALAAASSFAEPMPPEPMRPAPIQPEPPAYDSMLPERRMDTQYDVVLPDSLGHPLLAFKNGQWFRFSAGGAGASPVTVRTAVLEHGELAGSVVQIICWWMRENSRRERALDIATELALAVTELTHVAELRKKAGISLF
jgi:hypothetical protein